MKDFKIRAKGTSKPTSYDVIKVEPAIRNAAGVKLTCVHETGATVIVNISNDILLDMVNARINDITV